MLDTGCVVWQFRMFNQKYYDYGKRIGYRIHENDKGAN